jgi:hypothetical protein
MKLLEWLFGKKDKKKSPRPENPKRVHFYKDEKDIKIVDIFKHNGDVYKFYCDVRKAEATMGANTNYACFKLTEHGWVMITDFDDISIPKVSMKDDQYITVERINAGFEEFKKLIVQL